MICPSCGHIQSEGKSCQQCGSTWISGNSASSSSSDSPKTKSAPNSGKPEKYRPRALHDLDLTISFPGLNPETKNPAQPSAQPLAPVLPTTGPIICTTTPMIEGRPIQKHLEVISIAMFSPISVEKKNRSSNPPQRDKTGSKPIPGRSSSRVFATRRQRRGRSFHTNDGFPRWVFYL